MAGNTQLVSISPDGEIATIRRKRDQGLDLRDVGGEFSVRRVSEIAWSDKDQGFCIFLQPKDAAPEVLTMEKLHAAGMTFYGVCKRLHSDPESKMVVQCIDSILYFDDYEDAVTIEVEYLEALKALGTPQTVW